MKILNSQYEIHEVAVRLLALLEMSIRSYFQPENGLPDPKESLSCSLPSQAIALPTKEVGKVIGRTKKNGMQRTEYRSTTLWGSLLHCKTSPRQGFCKYDGHEYTIPYAALPRVSTYIDYNVVLLKNNNVYQYQPKLANFQN